MRRLPKPLLADLGIFVVAWLVRYGWMARWGRLHRDVDLSDLRSMRRVFEGLPPDVRPARSPKPGTQSKRAGVVPNEDPRTSAVDRTGGLDS